MKWIAVVIAVLAFAGDARAGSYAGRPVKQGGYTLPAKVQGSGLALGFKDRFQARFWPGVNLGVTVPGHAPGELAPTRRDYDRWLDGMGDLGVRVVRVYTILKPVFYEALDAYNARHKSRPLYFIQGVWIPEEQFLATQNAYAISGGFDREITNAVNVVHGRARIARKRGHAFGRYRTDVSRWLLAWSPGVEWDPGAVAHTDAVNAGAPPYAGRYIQSLPGATPMESWLAARLDHLAGEEAAKGWSRPVTFTNWLTTDPLEHPAEPFVDEDRVSVDATHLQATAAWPGGFFASYHAYPYYPDFLRLEPAYRAAPSGYAAYLKDLKAHHGNQVVMITEFGVPTGRAAAHRGLQGRDQGDHSEPEAARMDAAMLKEIKGTGFAGGLLFEWADEWFKRAWNTQDLAQPVDRRVYWHNLLTNETQFGVIATEPAKRSRPKRLGPVTVRHDAEYLYLRVKSPATVTLGGDRRLTVTGKRARLEQTSASDPMPDLFGLPRAATPWVSPRLVLSRPLTVPSTGEQLGFETLDMGTLAVRAGEVRIPWMLLGFADPSSRLRYVTRGRSGPAATEKVAGIAIDGRRYTWPTWDTVSWTERRKTGWPILRRLYARVSST